jgi:hypothetical protein
MMSAMPAPDGMEWTCLDPLTLRCADCGVDLEPYIAHTHVCEVRR